MINLRTVEATQPNQLTSSCHSISDIRFSNRVVGNMGEDLSYGERDETANETILATENEPLDDV
ncbi:hypothetical protein PHLGIDRAFT_486381 [Phlebiopsis gigantea 11061_1 CR5-6]|uniref:Uncharacterized protein n=1 Tax=Phlebiopsis gigantea (strain 11061_1 CR5-6) TaxID=745531 RepID=A0A0C3S8X3_PHLG1|nr:hypothetical protein PHLGIDRAFT_486381 [Phlebiopsis gigantea 11061_1 CR5-6]